MSEVWKNIEEYEGIYQVSNFGNVKSLRREVKNSESGHRIVNERILKKGKHTGGYEKVTFGFKGKNQYVHRLVANAFLPNPKNMNVVNHIDGNKTNNHYLNLEWCTPKENSAHALKMGSFDCIKGVNNHKATLTEKQVLEIREKYVPFKYTQKILAKEYNINIFLVRDIVNRVSWKHI